MKKLGVLLMLLSLGLFTVGCAERPAPVAPVDEVDPPADDVNGVDPADEEMPLDPANDGLDDPVDPLGPPDDAAPPLELEDEPALPGTEEE